MRAGKKIEDLDLFGATEMIAGAGASKAGRPRLPTRLMVALLYLKHTFDESDEALSQAVQEALSVSIDKAKRLIDQ